ncbi:MAG: hypothetical protein HYX42_16750 [Polaromonas sp.]|uniref:hypothetical protein n=1 Tax=Polaromonas sp. TaxID=1869339 RepID=UPI0025D30608|nr:hypothetical protein [Polaromonas sp.]MBI2727893.1 hypothetical protein [Polaromonas sp.]
MQDRLLDLCQQAKPGCHYGPDPQSMTPTLAGYVGFASICYQFNSCLRAYLLARSRFYASKKPFFDLFEAS